VKITLNHVSIFSLFTFNNHKIRHDFQYFEIRHFTGNEKIVFLGILYNGLIKLLGLKSEAKLFTDLTLPAIITLITFPDIPVQAGSGK